MLLHSLYCYQESSHTAKTLLLSRVHHVGSIADCVRKPGARSMFSACTTAHYRALLTGLPRGPGPHLQIYIYIYIHTYATQDHILHNYWPRCARQLWNLSLWSPVYSDHLFIAVIFSGPGKKKKSQYLYSSSNCTAYSVVTCLLCIAAKMKLCNTNRLATA